MRRKLNIDPFEFRLINSLDVGLPTAADHVLEEGVVAIKETIEAARDSFLNEELPTLENAKIGVGVASAVKNIGFGHNLPESSGAIAELSSSGGIKVWVSQHEYGQGSVAGLIQLAADTLAIPVDSIQLIGPDTANTPKTGPTTASRQTFMTGNAVVMACSALKKEILHHVANKIECDPLQLEIRGRYVIHTKKMDTSISLDELNCNLRVERRYVPPSTHALLENEPSHFGKPDFVSRMTHWCYTYSTQVAIVGVWQDTGVVKVIKVLSANDVGKVINLKAVEGQIYGGVVMGLGHALSEEFVVENGIPKTNTFGKCHVPTADQAPDIEPIIVEIPHPFGPEGAKGFAEGPSLATAPAILNAIYDAVHIRIKDLPANKNRIKKALQSRDQS
jgi:CO/xanthine dehydrogenase Mo-binding subunit